MENKLTFNDEGLVISGGDISINSEGMTRPDGVLWMQDGDVSDD